MATKRTISARAAKQKFGIGTSFELMENGEFRSRMTPQDGNGYIRTKASSEGAWQDAHFHQSLSETYVVVSGWIASAEQRGSEVAIRIHFPGDVFTTKPNVSHNIYMAGNSVIHTVKHGGSIGDWHADHRLTAATKSLSEQDIIAQHKPPDSREQFSAYVEIYNNLDNLIWSVPGLMGAGGAITVGFLGSLVSRQPSSTLPTALISAVLLFAALLFFLSYISMTRIREHHTMVGDILAEIEGGTGYFALRKQTVRRKWPPSATTSFRMASATLAAAFASLALIIQFKPSVIHALLATSAVAP